MVFEKDTDGKTAQVQNHQLESTTSSPKISGEANPDENIIADLMNGIAFKHVFSQKKFIIYVELPFIKHEENCTSFLEKLTYVINNSRFMETMPFTDNPFFKDLDEAASFLGLSPEEITLD